MTKQTVDPTHVLPPRAAKRYDELTLVGRGGMGEVYRARDVVLRRIVALKIIAPSGRHDRSSRERFRREVVSLACVNHPNVVQVHHFDEEEGFLYLVMEFVDGRPLKRMVTEGPLPLAQAVKVISQVADGLEAFHAAGVYHRDITPANILVDGGGRAKLMDFGCAGFDDKWNMTRLTKTGHHVGTFAYMPPEVFQGKDWDTRSDVYQLGLVFYEALTGKQPREASQLLQLAEPNADIAIRPPSALVGTVDEALDGIVLATLATSRAHRVADVATFRDQLLAWYACYLRQTTAREEAKLSQRISLHPPKDEPSVLSGKVSAVLAQRAAQNVAARAAAGEVDDDSMFNADVPDDDETVEADAVDDAPSGADGGPADRSGDHRTFRRKSIGARLPRRQQQAVRDLRRRSLTKGRRVSSRPPTMPSAAHEQIQRHQIEVARMAWWRKRMTIGLLVILVVGVAYRRLSIALSGPDSSWSLPTISWPSLSWPTLPWSGSGGDGGADGGSSAAGSDGTPGGGTTAGTTAGTTTGTTTGGPPSPRGTTPPTEIHPSATGGAGEVKAALDGGADPNRYDAEGLMPLHLAVIRNQRDVSELLLERGAAVDATDKHGYAALHWAAFLGRVELSQYLLDKGANVNFGWKVTTPLHAALQGRQTEMERIMRKAAPEVPAEGERSQRQNCLRVATTLLERGADVRAQDARKRTPLHLAVALGDDDVVTAILKKGADVNARDYQGETPLFNALRSRSPQRMVKLLLDAGAQAAVATNTGTTPLALATHLKLISVAAILKRVAPGE